MNVGSYMCTEPVTVQTDAPLSAVRQVMDEKGFSLLLVVGAENELAGFITRGALKGVTDWDLPVEKVTFEARFAVRPDDTMEKAALILLRNQLVLLPVVNDKQLVGVISQSEILRALAQALGIGATGTRITVKIPHNAGKSAMYRILNSLAQHDVQLVSLAQGAKGEAYHKVILRVQGVADKEGLCTELEAVLREQNANDSDNDALQD